MHARRNSHPNLAEVLRGLARDYPPPLQPDQLADVKRQAFQVRTAAELAHGGPVVDIGGGICLFSVGCAALGLDASVVDDFGDPINAAHLDVMNIHRDHGVKVIARDVIADGLDLEPGSVALVTCFESMEHWHASPKDLFADIVKALRPGGWFFLGVPNCVNLRKRIGAALGRSKWSTMADWYETPTFRGHVREPDVADLRYIARDMGLVETTVFGCNWLAYTNRRAWVRAIAPMIDRPLRARPALCSDIYLVGRKP
ncbi:MAG: hypothetical protein QOJ52_1995 [Acidimicrobiaceae bacterium]|jgi:SAM-dependent methyltransferase|nr:hypothetical protein [Acidimicrobiaceae bacterium]MDQ1420033.1 hypothetical protein [Acidimicrobiaceae bacterium]MDQ1442441.1 hypothetical protein [Acidimicrobiaceae bacterium]